MIEVIAVTPERVTISSKGLYRVRMKSTGAIIGELLTEDESAEMVETIGRCGLVDAAEAVTYEALASSLSN